MKIILVGAPNVGKTTLFNFLTKNNNKISNLSGTTVGFSSSNFIIGSKKIELVDTPGLYTMYSDTSEAITDKMVKSLLLHEKYDLIINVITEDNLHNNLLLTSNILDLGVPTIVIVNITNNDKSNVNESRLEVLLGCKVLKLNLNKLKNTSTFSSIIGSIKTTLKKGLSFLGFSKKNTSKKDTSNDKDLINSNILIKELIPNSNYIPAPKIFYGSQIEIKLQNAKTPLERFETIFKAKNSFNLAEKISKFANRVTKSCTTIVEHKKTVTDVLDTIFLNKVLGLPIFLLVMYIFFFVVINVSKVFQDFFDNIANILFIAIPTAIFNFYGIDNIFSSLVISLGSAFQVLATFIPILFIFYICLELLENSGYMSRGAYLTDSIMRTFGLPGKSLITMLVGFGCNVPAILSTRTVSNKVDRILTIIAAPFISCSARLTVFVLFIAIFFPTHGVSIIFGLYLFGIIVAVFSVWFFKNTLFKNKESYFILELPKYRLPKLSYAFTRSLNGVYSFVFKRAGKVIIPVMMIFYILNYTVSHSQKLQDNIVVKALYESQVILAPMGITKDNWEATMSLVGGTVAKEIVVTTLQSLYLINNNTNSIDTEQKYDKNQFILSLKEAYNGIKEEAKDLVNKLSFKIDTNSEYYSNNLASIMIDKFKGPYGAISYLIFTVIYTPCLITLGAVRKELNSKWMHFINIWTILLAYICASCSFQLLTFNQHKLFSSCWFIGCFLFFIIAYKGFSKLRKNFI